jgi:hypothetical protein
MNIEGHTIHITPTTRDSRRIGGKNEFGIAWYIHCVTCDWREKAADSETAQVRAFRHAEGAKLP